MNPYALLGLAALAVIVISLRLTRHGRTHIRGTDPLTASTLTAAAINYAGNPYRVGAYVYVMETGQPSEHDWTGTYIGMHDGYALIRDQTTHVVASVNKDQLYAAQQ